MGSEMCIRDSSALPEGAVVFGEISLSGALRPAPQTENRLKEAQKLGFTGAITPAGGASRGDTEMNVSFWDGDLVQGLRSRLVGEQGGFDSSGMSGVEAVDRLAGVARANAGRREAGEVLQGFACAIDPATWAT